ncbi:MAG: hemolysin family protein [Eggerthellaceae bacterium]
MPIWVSLLLVVLFLLMNAFFVMAEFSLVRVRKSQIELLLEEGKAGAKRALHIAENVNAYLSACQLGITLASLALGWLGEPAISALFHPVFAALNLPDAAVMAISVAIGYFIMTALHVVVGELVPKSMAILNTESYALHTAGPLHAFYMLTYPIMWLFNTLTNGIMRLTGHDPSKEHDAYSEEEIKILLEESAESGSIEQDQYQYLDNIFDLDDKDAKSIMTPRIEVMAIDLDDDLETNLDLMGKNKFTRYPVFREDKDNIIGFVHIKDAYLLPEGSTMKDLRIRTVQVVPESLSIVKLLQMLQAKHTKIAVVVDEHGGTAGIVTMSDVVEQIIGRMEDEYLHDDQDEILKVGDDRYLVDGSLPVDQFVEFLGFEPVPVYDYETASGLMLDLIDKIPEEGDTFELSNDGKKYTLCANLMDGLRIDKIGVRIERDESAEEGDEDK